MRIFPGLRKWFPIFLATSLAAIAPATAVAGQAATTTQAQRETTTSQANTTPQDPIAQLNLSPEQRQQIRAIREQSKEERATINQRVRESQRALREAQDADTPNEALIEQRAREAGEAQAAQIRMQASMESRIRRVLTPEQARTLRLLRAQAQQIRRGQRLENQNNNAKGSPANARPVSAQRNGMAPLRRNGLPRKRPL